MNLDNMKEEYAVALQDHLNAKSATARNGIRDALYILKKKIDAEEIRVNSDLKKVDIGGVIYNLPTSFSNRGLDLKCLYSVGEVLYFIDESNIYDSDGSYCWHHYAWVPQRKDKFVRLLVRTLGGDRFGDRFFTETSYYKHPADPYPYMTKHVYVDNRTYRPHVKFIINKIGLEFDKTSGKANELMQIRKES
ncbi:hypothetical protein [Paenibacillus chitinolyticus]|uniref:hypothetical protein n=1 Tax=Paenibacillus chitinolyticus TaxID=79263 RepID=UPI00366DE7FE